MQREGVFDIWGSDFKPLTPKPILPDTKKTYKIPTLIAPHAGQSINPSIKAQNELMQQIVDQVEIKRGTPKVKNTMKPIPIKKMKAKTKKQAEEFRKLEEQRKEKARMIDSRNAAKFMREASKFATETLPQRI